jgi:hypothetical protein
LLHVLEVLDQWIDASDAYDADPERGLHYDTLGQAVGERGDAPITTLVPGGEFAAEVALVRAAKDEVRQSSEANRAKLQQCADALAEQDKQHPEGPQPE